ncbi:hypothetical protein V6N13_059173 [Hibiscus sabdariffa]|uniref:Uncharacterized protein n=1 Tax=Hibiscus sabdariffa TaxID=183260 RepID=A0ABR2GDU0_9ROSI
MAFARLKRLPKNPPKTVLMERFVAHGCWSRNAIAATTMTSVFCVVLVAKGRGKALIPVHKSSTALVGTKNKNIMAPTSHSKSASSSKPPKLRSTSTNLNPLKHVALELAVQHFWLKIDHFVAPFTLPQGILLVQV